MDILEFAERSDYSLFPVQKILLKAIYGIALDEEKSLVVRDWVGGNLVEKTLTEKTYLEYLYDEGRSSIRSVEPGREFRNIVLCLGLRSGKDCLLNLCTAYETHLVLGDSGDNCSELGIVRVESDRTMSDAAKFELSCFLNGSRIFDSFRITYNRSEMKIRHRDGSPDLARVRFVTANSVYLKGYRNRVAFLNEAAYYDSPSARSVYLSLLGTTSGVPEGKIVLASSPNGRKGLFYERFKDGLVDSLNGTLCMRIPTWELNPTIPVNEYRKKLARDTKVFRVGYGAEWE